MEKVKRNFLMEIYIKVNMLMGDLRVMVNIIGLMVLVIKDNLKMALDMVKAVGKVMKRKWILINMKEIMKTTKNVVMEFLFGVLETHTKGIISII